MKTTIKLEFPCGYKYEFEGETGLWEMGNLRWNEQDVAKICPIHGKSCPNSPVQQDGIITKLVSHAWKPKRKDGRVHKRAKRDRR